MARDLVAGIDSSTQSCTIVLRRLDDGAAVAQARTLHPKTTSPRSEQSPEAWWQALLAAFGELAPYLPRIAAVSVGGQGHGLVMLDGDGRCATPSSGTTPSPPPTRRGSASGFPPPTGHGGPDRFPRRR